MAIERISNLIKNITSEKLNLSTGTMVNFITEFHLLFINDFSVPFDNNLSERDLRHVKSKVKISGCFRSLQGLQNYLNVKSIIETCKKKSLNFYEIILNLFKKIPVNI